MYAGSHQTKFEASDYFQSCEEEGRIMFDQYSKSHRGPGNRLFATLLLCCMVIATAGCATPATIEGMTLGVASSTPPPASFPLKGNVSIGEISGGSGTNPLWVSKVSNEDFRNALEASLRQAELLAADSAQGLYMLNAVMLELDQPLVGLDMRVNSAVRYELLSRSGGERLWEEIIKADYTATMSDAFLGVERLRLANEGAIRENLKHLISRLHRFPD